MEITQGQLNKLLEYQRNETAKQMVDYLTKPIEIDGRIFNTPPVELIVYAKEIEKLLTNNPVIDYEKII